MISTRGTAESYFLNAYIEVGILAVEDPESSMCFFNWGLAPGLDADNQENWWFHPGLAAGLIRLEDIEENRNDPNLSQAEWERGYMNRQTDALDPVFDPMQWASLYEAAGSPSRRNVAIGWDVSPDRNKAAIVAAFREGGNIYLKVLRTGKGTSWLAPDLEEIYEARPFALACDRFPENQVIADAFFAEHGAELRELTAAEWKVASVAFKAGVEDAAIRHDGHLALTDAISRAQKKPMGNSWVFDHLTCEPVLLAAVVAYRLITEMQEYRAPVFISESDIV